MNPCKKICVVDQETDLCIGCGRTTNEIARWPAMTEQEQQVISLQLEKRKAGLTKRKTRKGGRAGRLARTN